MDLHEDGPEERNFNVREPEESAARENWRLESSLPRHEPDADADDHEHEHEHERDRPAAVTPERDAVERSAPPEHTHSISPAEPAPPAEHKE